MLRSFYFIFSLIFILTAATEVIAAQDPVFTVKDIKVDVTAKNSVVAQKQAFIQAQRSAFEQLVARLLAETEREQFIMPEAHVISTLVKDYEITEEQLSRVRYIGIYTFRFKNDKIRSLLTEQGIHYTDVSSKPILVLPFYQAGADTVLWGEQNPFLMAWGRVSSYQGLVPIIVPIGDLQDVSDMGKTNALSYDPEKLSAMTNRYRAGEAIILVAIPHWSNSAVSGADMMMPSYIDIALYRTDRAVPEFSKSLQVRATSEDTPDTFFDRAVEDIQRILQEEWKTRTTVDPTQGNMLKVRVRFNSMKEWIDTQKALKRVQGISNMQILSLTPNQASLGLTFQGSVQRLRLALLQTDMTLTTPTLQFGNPYAATPFYDRVSSPLIYDLYLNKYKKTY